MSEGAEAALLLACARVHLRPDDRARIARLLEGPLDGDAFLALAGRHGLVPLVERHLGDASGIPEGLARPLWVESAFAARRNRVLAAELLRILDQFEAHGIAVLPFKGPALAADLYGCIGLRPSGDLDLLLPRESVPAASRLLEQEGYRAEYPLTPALEAACLAASTQYHWTLCHDARGIAVELHWKTDPDYPVGSSSEAWWGGLPRTRLEGRSVRTFSSRELLLVLLLHGAKHRWDRLMWLVDVAELLSRDEAVIDWDRVLDQARRLGCETRALLGLELARRLLDSVLPEAVARRIAACSGIDALADRVVECAFAREGATRESFRYAHGFDLRLHDGVRRKATMLANIVFAPSLVEWSRWPLPRALRGLYVPLRLGRLARKYSKRLVGRG